MTIDNINSCFKLLDSISTACHEIQQALKEHLVKTDNKQYKTDIDKDVVNLDNLKLIAIAVKEDINSDSVGSSTELLLRIAANDFKNKLNTIPEKKALIKDIIHSLKEVHREILNNSIKRKI